MHVLRQHFEEYYRTQGDLPSDLQALRSWASGSIDVTDAWGNEICYQIGDDGRVVLSSFGADGRPGGRAPVDADIVLRFAVTDGGQTDGGHMPK